jgi:lipoprotein LprG
MRRRPAAAALAAVTLSALITGCGLFGGDDDGTPGPTAAATDPATVLATARETLDATQSLAFDLDGTDLPEAGTVLVGGAGDLARPDGFAGVLEVRIAGNAAQVEIVSVGGDFYAKLPFTSEFAKVDPVSLGFTDPGTFMNPSTGITQLLTKAEDPVLGEVVRVDGEAAQEVSATLPGQVVADLLVSADPAADVDATFAVATGGTGDGQLRRAVLTGPFFAEGTDSTFTILLRDYGKNVQITPPG